DLAAPLEQPGVKDIVAVERPREQEEAVVAAEQRAAGFVQPRDVRPVPGDGLPEVEVGELLDDLADEPGIGRCEVAAPAQLFIFCGPFYSYHRKREAGIMPGDPRECRRHAVRCADLAHSARSPELKQTLIELSRNWVKLAIELERTYAVLDDTEPLP